MHGYDIEVEVEAGVPKEQSFTADKVGEPMRVAARAADQKKWFGVTPPDLSLVATADGLAVPAAA